MVRISAVEPGYQNVKPHTTTSVCFTQIVEAADGTRFLHMSTFGSETRASVPKSSQSMQFDVDTARSLVRALTDIFGATVLPKA
ncbi:MULTISPECIES: hypothetical protein [unclassified Microbacterium]|uniref:hypothetical protein n=1 Tax=unclassified Microbacterium TaxID=2609290 RepID=UPI0012F8CE40|nr:hypothetical protein [Microbacterium sp. MAH-37]MVQ41444.1 hypothetical protein [Microbacterium sp. MAH-37]